MPQATKTAPQPTSIHSGILPEQSLFTPASRTPALRFTSEAHLRATAAAQALQHQQHQQAKNTARYLSQLKSELAGLEHQVAIQAKRIELLRSMSPQDERTGLLGSAALHQSLRDALIDHTRYGYKGALISLDLNGFRALNATYGRAAGDAVLRHVASLLTQHTRDTDLRARLCDDSFVLILKEADATFANARAHHIAQTLHQTPCLFNGQTIPVSASIGVVTFRESPEATTLLQLAEHRMQAARRRTTNPTA